MFWILVRFTVFGYAQGVRPARRLAGDKSFIAYGS